MQHRSPHRKQRGVTLLELMIAVTLVAGLSTGMLMAMRGGLLSPRGYTPLYALMIVSHRVLRYTSPFLHLIALAVNVALVAEGAGALYVVTLALQLALLGAALAGGSLRSRPLLIARYYVLTTASLAAGLWDWLRAGTPAGWDAAEGTR